MHWEEPLPITTQQLIRELLTSVGYSNQALTCTVEEQLKLLENSLSPFLFTLLKAMTKTTFTVTRWKGGRFHDGIGTAAEVEVDGRVLPGITKQDVRERIEKLVKNSNIEWEITAFSEGYESSFDSPVFKQIREKMEEEISNCKTVPFISTGSSDGRFLRTFDSKVYGFSPMLPDMSFEKVLPMVHGINERIPLESLVFGIKVLYDVIYKSVTEEE
jgi:acetylornithine deacetylase/succinyl-diaminopimelate desuccinylase-like protein